MLSISLASLAVVLLLWACSLKGDLAYETAEHERQQNRADKISEIAREREKYAAELKWENRLLTEKLRASEEAMKRLDEYHKSTIAKRA